MSQPVPGQDAQAALQAMLGYLNFSSGVSDPKFLRNINELYRELETKMGADGGRSHEILRGWLSRRLDGLKQQGGAFADIFQAQCVIELVFDHLLPAYRKHHGDLLFRQRDEDLWRPLFLGRCFEAVLAQGPPWDEYDRLVTRGLARLNNFIGYRPVAVLENEQRMEPYAHEWVCPIPLFIPGAGVAVGRYENTVDSALSILRNTDQALLDQAWFDLSQMKELAVDPRAYDFYHPVNQRPNFHFGQWDPHWIDQQGRYGRFVLQQVTLDALQARLDEPWEFPQDELRVEAAAVLAGTMLMASGITGSGPDTHPSTTNLGNLLPHIAAYRDRFYEELLERLQGPHALRLRREAQTLRQPFGGVRQHFNRQLSRLRATQLQNVHLARLLARMGYAELAASRARTVRVPSARMLTQIDCILVEGHAAVESQRVDQVPAKIEQIDDLLQRAIQCGAVVDPWNIIGFGGNFSLFPALENSIHDFRADELIGFMQRIFGLCAKAWIEAEATDDRRLAGQLADTFRRLAEWWDQFATESVSSVQRLVGHELEAATSVVAESLRAWRHAGTSAGDLAFWRGLVDRFDSPRTFHLVIEALLDQRDYVASTAILMQWLGQATWSPLGDEQRGFHQLAQLWIHRALGAHDQHSGPADPWPLVQRFFDQFEANAQDFWEVPRFELGSWASSGTTPESQSSEGAGQDEGGQEDDVNSQSHVYRAAYEGVTYRDSTDDGVDDSVLDGQTTGLDDHLESEAKRLHPRLVLLQTVARLWKQTAIAACTTRRESPVPLDRLRDWHTTAANNAHRLEELLEALHRYPLAKPSGSPDSLVEYDRLRSVKEMVLERAVATYIEMADAERFLAAAAANDITDSSRGDIVQLWRALLAGDAQRARQLWHGVVRGLHECELLYVPLGKGGDPRRAIRARSTQRLLSQLAAWLPRLGLIRETCELLDVAQSIERNHPAGPAAVTEFDSLFDTGFRAIVYSIVKSAAACIAPGTADTASGNRPDNLLLECLQQLTESQLRCWLRHSRMLRLSVVEKLADEKSWQHFVRFVQRYGHDLFTQQFLGLANVRAIVHHGVDSWLNHLEENGDTHEPLRLLEDLDRQVPRGEAISQVTLALEAVWENISEYRDYNATTTQSDRGELLYAFIDLLRLRSQYDRIAWNLKPLVIVHEVLVREGRSDTAETWLRALADRTRDAADRLWAQLQKRSGKYGLRLSTVTDRIRERFVLPLVMDRVRALVKPAMLDAQQDQAGRAFLQLQEEIDELAREPAGAGLEVPEWIQSLEEEVAQCENQIRLAAPRDPADPEPWMPQVLLTWDEIQAQLADASGAP